MNKSIVSRMSFRTRNPIMRIEVFHKKTPVPSIVTRKRTDSLEVERKKKQFIGFYFLWIQELLLSNGCISRALIFELQ